jgi:cell division control protein 24
MWRQQDDPDGYEFFVMHVKSSETVNKWEAEIQKLMRADALRREERERRSMQRQHQYMPSSANFPLTPASDRMYRTTPSGEYFTEQDAHRQQWDDDGLTAANTPSTTASNTPNSFVASSRRTMSGQGIPDRYSAGGPSRTSDDHYHGNALSQWRYNQNGMPAMPPLPRAVSSSVTDQGPDGHYRSNSRSISGPARHYLHDVHDDRSGGLPYLAESSEEVLRPSMAIANARYANGIGMLRSGSGVGGDPSTPQQHPAALRMRSASSPNVYQVPHVNAQSNARQPPMPFAVSAAMTPGSSGQSWNSSRDDVLRQPGQFGNKPYGPSALPLAATSETQLSVSDFAKRSSNSSESTELSELSSHSPETPYGGQIGDSMQLRPRVSSGDSSKNVIIKVHFNHVSFACSTFWAQRRRPDWACAEPGHLQTQGAT